MLQMTTTPSIDGRAAKTVLGIVSGEAVVDVALFGKVEQSLHDARATAMAQMSARAEKLGASAVVGVAFELEALSPGWSIVMTTGTAVVL